LYFACFEFVGFSQNDFRKPILLLPFFFEYGLYFRLSTNRLFDMEILRSLIVDYYFRFGVFGLVRMAMLTLISLVMAKPNNMI
jgi:hypothetical protein